MAALQFDVSLTLDANRSGSTLKVVDQVLTLTDQDADLSTSLLLTVLDDAADQDVALGGIVTVKTLLMLSDRALTVKLDGEADGHLCKRLFLTDAAITAITLTNDSGAIATVQMTLLG